MSNFHITSPSLTLSSTESHHPFFLLFLLMLKSWENPHSLHKSVVNYCWDKATQSLLRLLCTDRDRVSVFQAKRSRRGERDPAASTWPKCHLTNCKYIQSINQKQQEYIKRTILMQRRRMNSLSLSLTLPCSVYVTCTGVYCAPRHKGGARSGSSDPHDTRNHWRYNH